MSEIEYVFFNEWAEKFEPKFQEEAWAKAKTELAKQNGDWATAVSSIHDHGEKGVVYIVSALKKKAEEPPKPKPVKFSKKSLDMLDYAIEKWLEGKSVIFACSTAGKCIPTYNAAVDNLKARQEAGEELPTILYSQLNCRLRMEKTQTQIHFVSAQNTPSGPKVDAVIIDPDASLTKEHREKWLARKIVRNLGK